MYKVKAEGKDKSNANTCIKNIRRSNLGWGTHLRNQTKNCQHKQFAVSLEYVERKVIC